MRILEISFERDWSDDLGAMLMKVTQRIKKKYIFLVSGTFLREINSVMLLGFKCTINPQTFIKIVGAIFQKIETLNFSLCELSLILRVDRKREHGQEIFARGLQVSNLNKICQLV